MSILSLRLPEDVDKRLNFLAQETGRTKTYYAREAIVEHIEELEDVYLALNRLEKPSKRWTLAELEKNLDVDG